MGIWKIRWRGLLIGIGLTGLGVGCLWAAVCGCTPKIAGVATGDVKPSATGDGVAESAAGAVGGDVTTTSNVYNVAVAGAGWLLLAPLAVLFMRKRTAMLLVKRLATGLELFAYEVDSPDQSTAKRAKCWIKDTGNCAGRPDSAERMLRRLIDAAGWRKPK